MSAPRASHWRGDGRRFNAGSLHLAGAHTSADFDNTVKYLHEYLINNEPFDGVIGFSQGAAMAAALTALLEKPGLHPDFPANDKLKPLKCELSERTHAVPCTRVVGVVRSAIGVWP